MMGYGTVVQEGIRVNIDRTSEVNGALSAKVMDLDEDIVVIAKRPLVQKDVSASQNIMTTEMAVADVPAPLVAGTLIGYLVVYGLLLFAYISVIVYLARKAARGNDVRAIDMSHSGKAHVQMLSPSLQPGGVNAHVT